MDPQILVASDPPHGDVDAPAVADFLGLDVETTRLKIAFPAPEILAATDRNRAVSLTETLTRHGMSVQMFNGQALANLPWPEPARVVELGPDGLVARTPGELVEAKPDERILVVSCQPPAELAREPTTDLEEAHASDDPTEVAAAVAWTPHIDLLLERRGSQRRLVVAAAVPETLARIEERFPEADIDRRLDNVRPRQRFVAGESEFDPDLRKAFSFGTLLLRHVLESIDPELRDVPQYEFASRLSYVVRILSSEA